MSPAIFQDLARAPLVGGGGEARAWVEGERGGPSPHTTGCTRLNPLKACLLYKVSTPRPPFGDAGEMASRENGSGTSPWLSAGHRNGLFCKIAGRQKYIIRIIGDRRGLSGRSMTRINILGISVMPYRLEPCM